MMQPNYKTKRNIYMKNVDKGNNNENNGPPEHADLQQNIHGWDTQSFEPDIRENNY